MEKITNVKALDFVLANCELPTEVKDKVERMRATFAKKSASTGEKKPTATQVANEVLKNEIYAEMEADTAYRVADMLKGFTSVVGLSSSKVTAMLTQMVVAKQVIRSEVKGKAYYTKVVA